jgi:SAM-dependent methyltransferase
MLEPTLRFSDRVDNYSKYRPTYPEEVITYLKKNTGLQENALVADIGSGTGIFTALLLRNGFRVMAVEPNNAMRSAAEEVLGNEQGFTSINGTAEHTTLAAGSVDLITVAQAFHWMEPAATRKEFLRILKPGGYVLLLWNIRTGQTPFMQAYEALKEKYGTDYKSIRKADAPVIETFFGPAACIQQSFFHAQLLDLKGLKGQLLSSSYIPNNTAPSHAAMMEELDNMFHTFQENGLVRVDYECKLYLARMKD